MLKKRTLGATNEIYNTNNTINLLSVNIAVRSGKYLYIRPKNKRIKTKKN